MPRLKEIVKSGEMRPEDDDLFLVLISVKDFQITKLAFIAFKRDGHCLSFGIVYILHPLLCEFDRITLGTLL